MNRPRLATNLNLAAGVAALGLFAVMALVFVGAEFTDPNGFASGASIMEGIGYALFDLTGQFDVRPGEGIPSTESFLLAFELIDVVLVAALVGSIMLARRESDDSLRKTLTDGGRDEE